MDDWFNKSRSVQFYYSPIKHTNDKFELYPDVFDWISFEELEDEVVDILDISNITNEHLQDKITGPWTTSTNKKLETEKKMTDGYKIILLGDATSQLRDFETILES